VIIVAYDPGWPALYEEEKQRVLEVVGDKVLAIEHIGRTAVPGLGAKPIIDMLVGVEGADDADECVPLLAKIGYADVTPEIGNPEWFYCLGKGPHSVGYHLHLVKYPSEHWERHILFRDYLRGNPEATRRYNELKQGLATKYGSDRQGYTEAKTSFIQSVISQARIQRTGR